jgi:hypothetical protein
VYHGPPEGPLAWTGSRFFGDPELPALIERHQPDVVLCGHIHEAPFVAGGAWHDRVGSTMPSCVHPLQTMSAYPRSKVDSYSAGQTIRNFRFRSHNPAVGADFEPRIGTRPLPDPLHSFQRRLHQTPAPLLGHDSTEIPS